MTRRGTLALATIALFASAGSARAQHTGIAVGAAVPVGDFANSSGTGFDAAFQIRTDPMIGPLPLRLELGFDHFSGKNGTPNVTISSEAVSVMGDFGSMFYWAAGPGYYQSNDKTQISGHTVTELKTYVGAQAALGMNIPVFRWEGFLEVSGVKLFSSGPGIVYVPLRFGIRL